MQHLIETKETAYLRTRRRRTSEVIRTMIATLAATAADAASEAQKATAKTRRTRTTTATATTKRTRKTETLRNQTAISFRRKPPILPPNKPNVAYIILQRLPQ